MSRFGGKQEISPRVKLRSYYQISGSLSPSSPAFHFRHLLPPSLARRVHANFTRNYIKARAATAAARKEGRKEGVRNKSGGGGEREKCVASSYLPSSYIPNEESTKVREPRIARRRFYIVRAVLSDEEQSFAPSM